MGGRAARVVPADPTVVLQIPSQNDPDLAPAGKHAASAFALFFPIEGDVDYGQAKVEMGQRVIDKITRLAPNFERSIIRHTTFTPKHMGVMFGAPGGDYCHGLLNANQVGPNRPGPRGFWASRSRSRGCTWAARDATADPASRSSPATTRRVRHWMRADPHPACNQCEKSRRNSPSVHVQRPDAGRSPAGDASRGRPAVRRAAR